MTARQLPPVLPRQQVLQPLPDKGTLFSGYKPWHWVLLAVGAVIVALIFGPLWFHLVSGF